MSPKAALVSLLLFLQLGAEPIGSSSLHTYLGDATGWNNAQKIVVSASGEIHIVYQQRLASGQERDLFAHARSLDGAAWEVTSYEGRWPSIALDPSSDEIFIAFVRRGAEQDELHLLRVAGDGETELLLTSSEPRSLFFPALAADRRSVYLAWEAHRGRKSSIEYAQLDLASQELQIEIVAEGERGLYFPSLAVGPDGLHLIWEEEADALNHRIAHGRRNPSAPGWEVEALPEGGEPLNARYPALDYDPDRQIYELVLASYSAGGNRIYYRTFDGEWSEPECLSCDLEPGYWTFPTVEDGHAVWGRQVAAGCPIGPVYYSHFTDFWSEPQALEGEFAAFPHLFREGSVLHLIWTDRDSQRPDLWLIRYRQLMVPRGYLGRGGLRD